MPCAVAFHPEERLVPLFHGAGEEQRDEVIEAFELARQACAYSAAAAPSLRGSEPPAQLPLTQPMAFALKVPAGSVFTSAWPSAWSCGINGSRKVPLST